MHGKISNVIFGYSAIITGDGTRIVAATGSLTKHPLNSELAFTEFSASTGKVVKILGRWPIPGLYPGQTQDVLWANSPGSTLIVLAHRPGSAHQGPAQRQLGRLRHRVRRSAGESVHAASRGATSGAELLACLVGA